MTVAEKIVRAKEDYDAVHEAGKQAEYDEFWDSFQQNGTRTSYESSFQGWKGVCFKPKHDLKFAGQYSCTNLFRQTAGFDLKEMTIDRGVALDFSEATRLNNTFNMSAIGNIPPIDLRSCTEMAATFSSMRHNGSVGDEFTTRSVTLNNLREDCTFNNVFKDAKYLENISITGTIGQNGFSVSNCTKLSGESIRSIVNALSDTAEGKTLTLSKTAVENAFPSEEAIEFYPDNETTTDNGYTFTVNDNGSITINGTGDKSELADGRFGYNISLPLPKGIYEFSLPSDTDSYNLYAYYEVYAPTYPLADVFVFPNNTQTVAIEDDEACALLSLIVSGGSTVDNITVKPTIKRIVTWDELAATKPNWTISLV